MQTYFSRSDDITRPAADNCVVWILNCFLRIQNALDWLLHGYDQALMACAPVTKLFTLCFIYLVIYLLSHLPIWNILKTWTNLILFIGLFCIGLFLTSSSLVARGSFIGITHQVEAWVTSDQSPSKTMVALIGVRYTVVFSHHLLKYALKPSCYVVESVHKGNDSLLLMCCHIFHCVLL